MGTPGGGGGATVIFMDTYSVGEAPASAPKPKILLRFTDHPKNTSPIRHTKNKTKKQKKKKKTKKKNELLAYHKKKKKQQKIIHLFMPIDEILSHPYDLSCSWDV